MKILTADWLLANGFEKKNKCLGDKTMELEIVWFENEFCQVYLLHGCYEIELKLKPQFDEMKHERINLSCFQGVKRFKYVHQLESVLKILFGLSLNY